MLGKKDIKICCYVKFRQFYLMFSQEYNLSPLKGCDVCNGPLRCEDASACPTVARNDPVQTQSKPH